MQNTFDCMGLAPVITIAPHPEDRVYCEDTKEEESRIDCLEAVDGTYWMDSDERIEHEEELVDGILTAIIEWSDEYRASEDEGSSYKFLIFENPDRARRAILKAIEQLDEYDEDVDYDDCFLNDMIDGLEDNLDWTCTHSNFGSSNQDVTLDLFDVGEAEEQIDLSAHEVLDELHKRGDLEGILDNLDSEFCFYRHNRMAVDEDGNTKWEKGDIVHNDCFTMYNNTNLWHHFGCTNEALLEAYKNCLEST